MISTQRPGREISIPSHFARRLADLITAEDDEAIIRTLREAMRDASVRVRVKSSREGGTCYVDMPDWRARGWAAVQLAQIKHGKPTQQVKIDVHTSERAPMSDADLRRELLNGWDEIRAIGDAYVQAAQHVLPAPGTGISAQPAEAELVDVDIPTGPRDL